MHVRKRLAAEAEDGTPLIQKFVVRETILRQLNPVHDVWAVFGLLSFLMYFSFATSDLINQIHGAESLRNWQSLS
jgi:hypothetical protein